MRDHASLGGGARTAAIVFAVVAAVNLAAGTDMADTSLDRALAAIGRAGRDVTGAVARRVAQLTGDRDRHDADVDADDERAQVDDDAWKHHPRCRARVRGHDHLRLRLCGLRIRCETREVHGHPRIVCGSPS
jgi:hypothetical protein